MDLRNFVLLLHASDCWAHIFFEVIEEPLHTYLGRC